MIDNIKDFFDELAPKWNNCRSNEEIERIEKIINSLPIKKKDKILDVACGTGVVSSVLATKSEEKVLGIDISFEMIKIANSNNKNPLVEYRTENFYELNTNNIYDAIVIFDAYPHFMELDKLKTALLNNLKENGICYIVHDLSRKQLDECHSGKKVSVISRRINSPEEEYKFYSDSFDLEMAYEDDSSYYLFLKKR